MSIESNDPTVLVVIEESETSIIVQAPGPQGAAGVVAASSPATYNAGTQTVGVSVGSTSGTVAAGDDVRLTDNRAPTAHTHPATEVTGLEAAIASKENKSEKDQPSGYAGLNSAGKVSTSSLPALGITSVTVAANQSAQLAAGAQEGDVIIRTDSSRTYIHNGGAAATMADFTELAVPPNIVQSVAGKTGTISLDTADIGGLADALNAKANTSHTHAISDTTGLQTSLDSKASDTDSRLFDARSPTAHKSTHATGGSDALTASDIGAAPSSHTHAISDTTGLQTSLDAKVAKTDLPRNPLLPAPDVYGSTGSVTAGTAGRMVGLRFYCAQTQTVSKIGISAASANSSAPTFYFGIYEVTDSTTLTQVATSNSTQFTFSALGRYDATLTSTPTLQGGKYYYVVMQLPSAWPVPSPFFIKTYIFPGTYGIAAGESLTWEKTRAFSALPATIAWSGFTVDPSYAGQWAAIQAVVS